MLSRRNFLTTAGSLAATGFLPEQSHLACALPKADTEFGRVKIRDVKTASVKLTYYDAHLVKITTDAGLNRGLDQIVLEKLANSPLRRTMWGQKLMKLL